MLLRTRVTLMVSCALLAMAATLVYLGVLRERLQYERFAQISTTGLATAWNALVNSRLQRMDAVAEELRLDLTLRRNLAGGDLDEAVGQLHGAEQEGLQAGWLSRLDLLDTQGRLVHTSSEEVFAQPILNRVAVEQVLASQGSLAGIGSDGAQGLVALVAEPLIWHDEVSGILTLATRMDDAVSELARSLDLDVLVVNRRGRVLLGTAPGLWQELTESGEVRRDQALQSASLDGRVFSIATVRIDGYAGPDAARLIAIRDATDETWTQRRIELIGTVGIGVLMLGALAWLFGYLRSSFRPLQRAIQSLRAIAAGDTSVSLDASRSDDEIGRIAGTVEALRQNAISLEQLRRSKARQRRREEQLIRRQMTALADTFEDKARSEIMAELAEIEQLASAQEGDSGAETSGLVGTTLEKLTGRVIVQHNALQQLVDELREALAAKTSLVALQQELDIARSIQRSVLPPPPPAHPRYAVIGSMQAAEEIGGDFYDFFQLDADHLAVAIADVSGKGVPAAFFMAIARTLLRATAALEPEPGSCVRRVNDALVADNPELMFVTMFYGVLDLRSGRLVYVNAGHNPPVLHRAGGEPSFVPMTQGISLGVMPGHAYREGTLDLGPGDRLFLYTDGVTEAMNVAREVYGEDRLLDAISASAGMTVAEQSRAVVLTVKGFEAGAPQSDDITCVDLEMRAG